MSGLVVLSSVSNTEFAEQFRSCCFVGTMKADRKSYLIAAVIVLSLQEQVRHWKNYLLRKRSSVTLMVHV